jgi:hypothetical protein
MKARHIPVSMSAICLTVCLITAPSPAFTQENSDQQLRAVKGFLEERARQSLAKFWEAFVNESGKDGRPMPSEKEKSDALDGVKLLTYNQAYSGYSCFKQFGLGEKLDECNRTAAEELVRFMGLSRYDRLTTGRQSAICEMKSRLFVAEAEFPPYDFLKGAQLFNFKQLNECLLENAR